MTRNAALLVLAASLASVTASQVILKARLTLLTGVPSPSWQAFIVRAMSDPYLWVGAACVGVGGICWYTALSKLPLNLMLPASSVIAPCASICAYYFLGENLTLAKIFAIAVIMIGVSWLGWLNA